MMKYSTRLVEIQAAELCLSNHYALRDTRISGKRKKSVM